MPPPRPTILALLTAILVTPSPAAEPPAPDRPPSARRVVRLFTFDEPDNPDPVPAHWRRAQDDPAPGGLRRPGFPAFNKAAFDSANVVSGEAAVKLPTLGGSTALRLQGGEVPVFPDADYAVSARVRTRGLEHARAFLTARLLDQKLDPIPGAEARSEPVLAEDAWADARVVLHVRDDRAAWLQIDLELLQPRQFQEPPAGPAALHHVWREDVAGAAWFDDVAVGLLPRIQFSAALINAHPTAVYTAGAAPAPELRLLARDQGGEALTGALRVLDIDGRTVAQRSLPIDPSGRPDSWAPALPGPGWYRATLDVLAAPEAPGAAPLPIWHGEQWLALLPARAAAPAAQSPLAAEDRRRFGVVADTLPEARLPEVPPAMARAGLGFVVIPAFDPAAPPESAQGALARRAPALDRLLGAGHEVTLALASVPPTQAASLYLDPADGLGWCARPAASWLPYLEPTLDVYGQRAVRYQLGRLGHPVSSTDLAPALSALRAGTARFVPEVHLSVPWRADTPLPPMRARPAGKPSAAPAGDGPDALTLLFPTGFEPGAMAALARVWRDAPRGELTVVPELLPAAPFGQRARLNDLVRRAVEFWAAFGDPAPDHPAARLGVASPFGLGSDDAGQRLMPAPELAALSALADRLSGRRIVGEVPAPRGVRALLLARRVDARRADARALAGACIVAWNESADAEHAWVEAVPIDQGVRPTDVFGVGTTLPAPAGALTRVPVGDAPVFIEDVDPYMGLFVGSFRVTPTFVPAVVSAHEHRLEFTNPWPVRITGQIQLKEADEPAGSGPRRLRSDEWTISPNVSTFALAPGERASLPVTLTFGPGQLAGPKDFVAIAKVQADRAYAPVKMAATLEVGLPELELLPEALLSPGPNGPDVIINAAVTNRDARPRTLRVEVACRDLPSQQLSVSDLPPGQTIVKRFVFRGGARTLRGHPVRVTLADDESAARLSKAVFVP